MAGTGATRARREVPARASAKAKKSFAIKPTRARYTESDRDLLVEHLRTLPLEERHSTTTFEKIRKEEPALQGHTAGSMYEHYHRNSSKYDEWCNEANRAEAEAAETKARETLRKRVSIFNDAPTPPSHPSFKQTPLNTGLLISLGLERLAKTHRVDFAEAVKLWELAGRDFLKADEMLASRQTPPASSSKRLREKSLSGSDSDTDSNGPSPHKRSVASTKQKEAEGEEADTASEDDSEMEVDTATRAIPVDPASSDEEDDSDAEDMEEDEHSKPGGEAADDDEDEDDDDDETGEGAVEANNAGNEEEDTEEEDSDEEKAPVPVPQPTTRKRSSTTATTASSDSEPEDDEEEEKEEEAYIPTQTSLFGTQMGPSRRRWG